MEEDTAPLAEAKVLKGEAEAARVPAGAQGQLLALGEGSDRREAQGWAEAASATAGTGGSGSSARSISLCTATRFRRLRV